MRVSDILSLRSGGCKVVYVLKGGCVVLRSAWEKGYWGWMYVSHYLNQGGEDVVDIEGIISLKNMVI